MALKRERGKNPTSKRREKIGPGKGEKKSAPKGGGKIIGPEREQKKSSPKKGGKKKIQPQKMGGRKVGPKREKKNWS